jgi:hypothetical protein
MATVAAARARRCRFGDGRPAPRERLRSRRGTPTPPYQFIVWQFVEPSACPSIGRRGAVAQAERLIDGHGVDACDGGNVVAVGDGVRATAGKVRTRPTFQPMSWRDGSLPPASCVPHTLSLPAHAFTTALRSLVPAAIAGAVLSGWSRRRRGRPALDLRVLALLQRRRLTARTAAALMIVPGIVASSAPARVTTPAMSGPSRRGHERTARATRPGRRLE